MSHINNAERLSFELDRLGHFTVEEGDRWTQVEIDAKWARQIAAKTQTTERSQAFILNWDFKPAPEPQYIIVNDDDHPQPSKPVISQCTPSNYWDEWCVREGIVMRHLTPTQYGEELRQRLATKKAEEERQKKVALRLLKKRKSDEDCGKYFYFKFKILIKSNFYLDSGDHSVNVNLPPISSSIPKTPSVEEFFICQSQYKDWLKTKNRGSINRRINIHKFEVHGIPWPTAPHNQKAKNATCRRRSIDKACGQSTC